MHDSSQLRMGWFANTYLKDLPDGISILDIGSYDMNGSYKHLFPRPRFAYMGMDMEAGPNVDIVYSKPYHWAEIGDESFDVVISGQTFEHIEFPWITMQEIARVLKKGGLMCITAPRLAERHRKPVDTYRYDVDGFVALSRYVCFEPLHASVNLGPAGCPPEWYDYCEGDALLVARKPLNWSGLLDARNYTCIASDLEALATGMIPYEQQAYAKKLPSYVQLRFARFGRSIRRRMEKIWPGPKTPGHLKRVTLF